MTGTRGAHVRRGTATGAAALLLGSVLAGVLAVGVLVAGEEVPHTHVHLIPFTRVSQLEITNAETDPDPAALDEAAARLRAALREAGHPETTDA